MDIHRSLQVTLIGTIFAEEFENSLVKTLHVNLYLLPCVMTVVTRLARVSFLHFFLYSLLMVDPDHSAGLPLVDLLVIGDVLFVVGFFITNAASELYHISVLPGHMIFQTLLEIRLKVTIFALQVLVMIDDVIH